MKYEEHGQFFVENMERPNNDFELNITISESMTQEEFDKVKKFIEENPVEVDENLILKEKSFESLSEKEKQIVMDFAKRVRKAFKDDGHNWVIVGKDKIAHCVS